MQSASLGAGDVARLAYRGQAQAFVAALADQSPGSKPPRPTAPPGSASRVAPVGPFTVKTATAAAFYTTPAEPDIHQSVIDYIAAFMSEHNGKNFSPHVTIGVGTTAFLDAMLAEPFTDFTFSPKSASVYQFGDFGAARKQLMALPAANR